MYCWHCSVGGSDRIGRIGQCVLSHCVFMSLILEYVSECEAIVCVMGHALPSLPTLLSRYTHSLPPTYLPSYSAFLRAL